MNISTVPFLLQQLFPGLSLLVSVVVGFVGFGYCEPTADSVPSRHSQLPEVYSPPPQTPQL